jgi:hypothetical protein
MVSCLLVLFAQLAHGEECLGVINGIEFSNGP